MEPNITNADIWCDRTGCYAGHYRLPAESRESGDKTVTGNWLAIESQNGANHGQLTGALSSQAELTNDQ